MAATALWLTACVTPLRLMCRGQQISLGTGFFLKRRDRWFVVSNWHVLSGRDPASGQPLNKTGMVPDACVYTLTKLGDQTIKWEDRTLHLGDALLGSASWCQHPTHGQLVDIGSLPIPSGEVGIARDLLEPAPPGNGGHQDFMWVDLGGEVFLPGYPLGLTGGGALPIWKRASLASSTEVGDGVDKYFYVDTATREGMSGAPCLAIADKFYYLREAGSMKMTLVNDPVAWRLMGIYSGRLNPSDSFEAQIGVVWRKELILETVDNGVPAGVIIAETCQT